MCQVGRNPTWSNQIRKIEKLRPRESIPQKSRLHAGLTVDVLQLWYFPTSSGGKNKYGIIFQILFWIPLIVMFSLIGLNSLNWPFQLVFFYFYLLRRWWGTSKICLERMDMCGAMHTIITTTTRTRAVIRSMMTLLAVFWSQVYVTKIIKHQKENCQVLLKIPL